MVEYLVVKVGELVLDGFRHGVEQDAEVSEAWVHETLEEAKKGAILEEGCMVLTVSIPDIGGLEECLDYFGVFYDNFTERKLRFQSDLTNPFPLAELDDRVRITEEEIEQGWRAASMIMDIWVPKEF